MWDKLLSLLKDNYSDDENYVAPSIAKREARREQLASQVPQESQSEVNTSNEGNGTLIGFNYLKGLDGKDTGRTRRFINLHKLLRGRYDDGQIKETIRGSKEDIRGEDT